MQHKLHNQAYKHILNLLNIGPRPSGSINEKIAFNYIDNYLKSLGYNIFNQEIKFDSNTYFNIYLLGWIILGISIYFIDIFPLLVIFLPLFIFSLPQINKWFIFLNKGNSLSQNLLAYKQEIKEVPILILCAHVDSAKASAFRNKFLLFLKSNSLFIAQRIAFIASILSLVYLVEGTFKYILLLKIVLISISIIFILIEFYDTLSNNYSPGAYDNAAGVGILLSLAEYFSSFKLNNLNLYFLFTGAEENGLSGSREFANYLNNLVKKLKLDKSKIFILNFDMIGAGDKLNYVYLDGTIKPIKTSPFLNSLILKAEPKVQKLWYTTLTGDFLPFLKLGFNSTSLHLTGSKKANIFYHTVYDDINVIELNSLELVINTTIEFIRLLENEIKF